MSEEDKKLLALLNEYLALLAQVRPEDRGDDNDD